MTYSLDADNCSNCHDSECEGCTTGHTDSSRDRDADMRLERWRERRQRPLVTCTICGVTTENVTIYPAGPRCVEYFACARRADLRMVKP